MQDQIDKKEKEIALKNKELQEITLILSKRDKEIASLKKEVDGINDEAVKMREYAKSLEAESNKKENTESVLGRVKDFTCSTLKIQCDSLMEWESSLNKAIIS